MYDNNYFIHILKMTLTTFFYIQTDSYFGEKSLEKNNEEIMESLIAGMACKIYDDLQDNPLLKRYRNKTFMEALKIVHAMFFTIISLKDSMFYYLFCLSIIFNAVSNPSAYTNPYENAMLWVYPILFFYMKQPTLITKKEVFFILAFLSTNFCESYYSQEEYSYLKCVIRLYFCILSAILYYLSTSPTLHHLMAYFIGYFGVSFLVQLHSTKSKNKRKHSPIPWANEWLEWLDKRLEGWFMKSKTNRKTIHHTYK